MNKIEAIKNERDGLDVREAIAGYAREGWESITEDDVQRLKWYGLFLRNPTPGFFMIRVRIPGGQATSSQIRALADPSLAPRTPLPTLEEAVRSGAWMVGPPERLVERLQELEERYPGLQEVHVGQVVGTDQHVILEQLEWFARDVMPVFKRRPSASDAMLEDRSVHVR